MSEEKEDNDSVFLEEEIYGKLVSLISKRDYDKMFLFRELSSLLVKEIKDLFSKYVEDKVKELVEMKNKLCFVYLGN